MTSGAKGRSRVRKSRKDEERLAKEFGGKRLVQSGARARAKDDSSTQGADISTKSFWIEHKRTERESLSIKLSWLDKVSDGARAKAKDPMLLVTFDRKGHSEDWVLVRKKTFLRLVG